MFIPELVLAHAIVERSATVEALEELRSVSGIDGVIGDLEVDYVPWSWREGMRALSKVLRKMLFCCSSEVAVADEVEMGSTETPHRIKWTFIHSYNANMGELRLECTLDRHLPSSPGRSVDTIAITSQQFTFLRKKGIIERTPSLQENDIEDKGKTDYFTKAIAVVQISWLILSMITRAARSLPIAQLEILTVAFATCAVFVCLVSLPKPQDICTATTVFSPTPLNAQDIRSLA